MYSSKDHTGNKGKDENACVFLAWVFQVSAPELGQSLWIWVLFQFFTVIINPVPFSFTKNEFQKSFEGESIRILNPFIWHLFNSRPDSSPVRCGHMPVLHRYDDDADQLLQPSKGIWRYHETSDEPEKLSWVYLTGLRNQQSVLPQSVTVQKPRTEGSESTGSSDSDDPSSESECPHGNLVDLRLATLNSLHTLNENSDAPVFSSHGMDRKRITDVLNNPPCECRCWLPAKVLENACKAFGAFQSKVRMPYCGAFRLRRVLPKGRGALKDPKCCRTDSLFPWIPCDPTLAFAP